MRIFEATFEFIFRPGEHFYLVYLVKLSSVVRIGGKDQLVGQFWGKIWEGGGHLYNAFKTMESIQKSW